MFNILLNTVEHEPKYTAGADVPQEPNRRTTWKTMKGRFLRDIPNWWTLLGASSSAHPRRSGVPLIEIGAFGEGSKREGKK
jgi:hypothetical protein